MKTLTKKELLELDAWIAEHVMRWHECASPINATFPCFIKWGSHITFNENPLIGILFSPTTDPAAAMQALEKCSEKCTVTTEFGRNQLGDNQFMVARLSDHDGSYVEDYCKCAPTLPLAICLFAQSLFSESVHVKELEAR